MLKKLSKVGYSVEIKFDRTWKVIIKCNGKELYFYIFNNKEDAQKKFDDMK